MCIKRNIFGINAGCYRISSLIPRGEIFGEVTILTYIQEVFNANPSQVTIVHKVAVVSDSPLNLQCRTVTPGGSERI
jgi:hypothetical protein